MITMPIFYMLPMMLLPLFVGISMIMGKVLLVFRLVKLLPTLGHQIIQIIPYSLELGQVDTSAFTVPVMLPTGGGGMESEDGYHPYAVGEMIMHDGKQLHRIASYKKYKQGEYRITLQGHIVRDDRGNLIMFW